MFYLTSFVYKDPCICLANLFKVCNGYLICYTLVMHSKCHPVLRNKKHFLENENIIKYAILVYNFIFFLNGYLSIWFIHEFLLSFFYFDVMAVEMQGLFRFLLSI